MSNFTDLIKKYAFEQYVHSGVIAIIDILISLIASMCTIVCIDAIMHDISIPLRTVIIVAFYTIVATIIGVLTMRTHRIIIRHSTIGDIWKLVVATIIKEILLGICAITVLGYTNTILPIILLFDALLTFSIFIITRIAMVIVYDTIKQSFVSTDLRRNIFIYGSSEKSTALKLRLDNSPHYKVVGFIQCDASSAKLVGINLYHFKN